MEVHSSKSDEEESLPVWVLEDDSRCYSQIMSICGNPHERDAEMIDRLIVRTAESKGCRLGRRSFSTSLHCDPNRHKSSLLMLSCSKRYDTGTAIHLLRRYRHLIDIHHQEWFKHIYVMRTLQFNSLQFISDHEWMLVSPLHAAAATGGLKTVQLLLEMGVDVNVRTCCQLTPLHMAAASSQPEVVKYLLEHGACVNATDRFGNTPLLATLWYNPGKSLARRVWCELMKGGANSLQRNHQGHTLMHLAYLKGNNLRSLLDVPFYLKPSELCHLLEDCLQDYVPPMLLHVLPERLCSEILQEKSTTSRINSLLLLGSLPGVNIIMRRIYWHGAVSLRERHRVFPDLTPKKEYGGRTEMATPADLNRVMQSTLEVDYQCLIIQQRCMVMSNLSTLTLLKNLVRVDIPNQPLLLLNYTKCHDIIWKQLPRSSTLGETIHLFVCSLDFITQYLQQIVAQDNFDFSFLTNSLLEGLEFFFSHRDKCLCQKVSLNGEHRLLVRVLNILLFVFDHVKSTFANDSTLMEEMDTLSKLFIAKFFYVQEPSLLHELLLSSESYRHDIDQFRLVCALLEWGGHRSVNVCYSSGCRPIHKAVVLGAPETAVHECVAVVTALLDAGAHVDAVTPEGKTALELCTGAEVKALLTSSSPEPLACLASRVIVATGIPYQQFECVSPRDKTYISLHDPVACNPLLRDKLS